jgi:hypothetical protein
MEKERSELEQELLRREINQQEKFLYENYKKRQRQRWISIAVLIAPLPFALAVLFDITEFTKLALYGATGSIFVGAILLYLQPSRVGRFIPSPNNNDYKDELVFLGRKNREFEKQNRELKSKIDKIISQLQKGEGSEQLFNPEEKGAILSRIQAKLESESLSEYKNHIVGLIEQELNSKSYDTIFEQTSSRLENEIQNQANRGNVNLILGITTTLTGVGILGYSVFNAPQANSTIELVSHFVPRISLVLLIEVFAYFFLKLYKQSLIEIKYFQNELTNVESKYLGVKLINGNDSGLLAEAVQKLLSTERNFILEKGQSTVDIDKEKIEEKNSTKITSVLEKAIEKIR